MQQKPNFDMGVDRTDDFKSHAFFKIDAVKFHGT